MDLARKKSEPVQETPAPVQPTEPIMAEQPPASEQGLVAGPTPSAEPEPLSQEALAQVTSWAVIDEDAGVLRAGPDEQAQSVRELPFATVLLVLEKEASWYKVALTDQKTWGWVSGEALYESPLRADRFRVDDLANFYYAASATMENPARKTRFLNLLIEQYPQAIISFNDPATKMMIQGVARELALFSLADIYRVNGEYQKTIEAYNAIIGAAKRSQVKGYAEWNLLKIYRNNLGDTQQSIDQALHIIESYGELALSGFEWNIWVDLSAAEVLLETLQSSNASGSDFVRYGERVLASSKYPPVQIMGSIISAEGHWKQNDLAAMERAILDMLKKHPTTPVQYFKRTEDYSKKAISFAVKHYIEGPRDYEAALIFSQNVLNNTSNKALADNAKFAIAYISDIWHFNREEVIAAYRDSGNVKDFLHDNGVFTSDTRLQAIQDFEPYNGAVVADGVSVRLEPDASSPVVLSLPGGASVTVLYGNPNNFQGEWVKVKTQDNRFGWVPEEALEKAALPGR